MVDPIWAGQYRFLQPLWEGKERIVFDPQLRAMMLAGVKLPWDKAGKAGCLIDALLAPNPGSMWLLVPDLTELIQAGVDPTRFGVRALHDGPLLALRRSWDVAMVDVTGLLDSMLAGGDVLAPEASLVDALLSSLTSQRHLVLWTRAEHADPKRCKRWRTLTRLLQSRNGPDPQTLVVGAGSTMRVTPFGQNAAAVESGVVDPALGTQADAWSYLAYLGPHPGLGARWIELPEAPYERPVAIASKRARTPLKQRLQSVQAELAQSEQARVALLEDLDRASAQLAAMHEENEELRDCAEPAKALSGPRTKVLAADEATSQALLLHATWEIERLRGQVAALRARPISEIEAENAQLVAALSELQTLVEGKLAATGQDLSIPTDTGEPSQPEKPPRPSPTPPDDDDSGASPSGASGPWSGALSKSQLSSAAWQGELGAIAASLQGLRARIERGELAPLPLQSKLRELELGVQRLAQDGVSQAVGQNPPKDLGSAQ